MKRASGATLAALGEFGFLAQVLPKLNNHADVLVGAGDDCAVIRAGRRPWLVTVDSMVEGTHFRRDWFTPEQLGRKSFLVNASDIAAMGGVPRHAVIAISAPASTSAAYLRRLQAGIVAAAEEHACDIVGGNLTRGRDLSITITLLGEAARRVILRRGAKPGDTLYVTGTLGDAARALHWLTHGKRGRRPSAALQRLIAPQPRLQAGAALAAAGIASSMIDLSDGLVRDLGHLCDASQCGASIDIDAVPCSARIDRRFALAGGEDYELLFTVPPSRQRLLAQEQPQLGCPITAIGRMLPAADGRRVRLLRRDGREVHLGARGFDHFAS